MSGRGSRILGVTTIEVAFGGAVAVEAAFDNDVPTRLPSGS
jgi:hypothetical protein